MHEDKYYNNLIMTLRTFASGKVFTRGRKLMLVKNIDYIDQSEKTIHNNKSLTLSGEELMCI